MKKELKDLKNGKGARESGPRAIVGMFSAIGREETHGGV